MLLHWLTVPLITGFYALALNLAFKVDVVNQTMNLVLLPTVSALRNRGEYGSYLRRSLARSLALAPLLFVGLPLARPFILTVYGSSFEPATQVFYLLMAVVLFDLVTNPLLLLAYPLKMPRAIAASDAVRVVTLALAGSLLIPIWGLNGAALAKLTSRLAGALWLGAAILGGLRRSGDSPMAADQLQDTDSALAPSPPEPM